MDDFEDESGYAKPLTPEFIQKVNDKISATSSYMFIGISPDALKKQDMAALERETVDTFSEDEL